MDTAAHKRPRSSTTAMQYSEVVASTVHQEGLPFDSVLLKLFSVQPQLADPLVNLIQAQYTHGNQQIREALTVMVFSMLCRVQECNAMERNIKSLQETNHELLRQVQELSEQNERLESDIETIPHLQVHMRSFETMHVHAFLNVKLFQTQLADMERNYSEYVEQSRELQANAFKAGELETENSLFRRQLNEYSTRIGTLETELRSAAARIQYLDAGVECFKDAGGAPYAFPVIQANGQVVDFYKIMAIWSKNADEDEDHPGRSYTCPSTRRHTTLAPFQITQRVQNIATSLGIQVEPPLIFEWKPDDAWVRLGIRTHLQLAARVCYIYANRKKFEDSETTNSLIADEDKILVVFKLFSVRMHVFVLLCII